MLSGMVEVVIGSEALKSGLLTRDQLQRYHRRVLPDVYVPKQSALSLRDRVTAAWLWSRRQAVVAGSAAAALYGARWVGDDIPIELIWRNGRPPNGLVVRNENLRDGEVGSIAGIPVTSLARTAFDLGRHLPRNAAVARLDALARAQRFPVDDVARIAERHPGARGLRNLRVALSLVDDGAASPRETWLRLLIIDAGLPVPRTQIPVHDDCGLLAMLDMGWEEFMVAAEYDGDQHRHDRRQYVWDQRRSRLLAARGWEVVRVIKEDTGREIIARISEALRARGWRGEIALTQAIPRSRPA